MADLAADIRKLVETLDDLPKTLSDRGRTRELVLQAVAPHDHDSIVALVELIRAGRDISSQMSALVVSMKNTAPIVAKFEEQATKDQTFLREILKQAGHEGVGLHEHHPIIRAQHDAVRAVRQKFIYAAAELENLRDDISTSFAAEVESELRSLKEGLKASSQRIREDFEMLTNLMVGLEDSVPNDGS